MLNNTTHIYRKYILQWLKKCDKHFFHVHDIFEKYILEQECFPVALNIPPLLILKLISALLLIKNEDTFCIEVIEKCAIKN